MLSVEKKPITCIKCGHEFGIDVYTRVDVSEYPELKEKVFRDEINSGICPNCGVSYQIMRPFLYWDFKDCNIKDIKRKMIMIWVYPEQEREKAEEIKKGLLNSHEAAKMWYKDHPLIIVFGIEELKKKLKELEDSLDEDLRKEAMLK